MAAQCKTYQTTGEHCHGFTNLLSPQCWGHSRELQIKVFITAVPGTDGGAWLQMTGTLQ